MRREEVRREAELGGGVADVEREVGPEAPASKVGAGGRDETATRFPRAGGIGGVQAQIPTDVLRVTDEVTRVHVRVTVGRDVPENNAIPKGEGGAITQCGRRGG